VAAYTPPEVIGTALDTVSASPDPGVPGWSELVVDGVTPAHIDFAATPDRVIADGASTAALTIRLAAKDGRPLSGHPVALDALEGAVGPAKDNGDGTYTATYTAPEVLPPTGRSGLVLRIGEAIPGEVPVTQEVSVGLRAGPAAKASYVIEPRRVPADGATEAKVYVTLVDATGNPADGRPVVEVEAGGSVGEPVSDTAGSWTVPWTPPSLPALQFTRRSEVFVRVDGKRIPASGQLRLESAGMNDRSVTVRTPSSASAGQVIGYPTSATLRRDRDTISQRAGDLRCVALNGTICASPARSAAFSNSWTPTNGGTRSVAYGLERPASFVHVKSWMPCSLGGRPVAIVVQTTGVRSDGSASR
jgi:hypothetical protein